MSESVLSHQGIEPEVLAPPESETAQPGGGMAGLFRLVRTRPWSLGAACVLSVLSAVVGLAPTLLVFGIAAEVLSNSPDADQVVFYASLGVAAALLKHLLFGASTILAHVAAYGILYDLRVAIARKMAEVPLGFFSRRQTGALHKAMNEDVQGLEAFLAHMLPDGVAAFTVPVAAIVLMFVVDWRMALAAFVAVPFALLAQVAMFSREARESYTRYHEATEANKRAVHDYLRGIHVIKTFGLDARSFGELRRAVQKMTDYVDDYARRSAPPFIVALKLLSGGTNALFIVPVGVWLLHTGTLDLATFVFFLLVSTQVLSPFLRIANVMGNLQLLLEGADNVQSILDEPSLPRGKRGAIPTQHGIRFANVSFGYDDKPVLHNVSFEAPAGKVTAIVGASGSGKTTLARLVPRFWDVDSGALEVGGVDVRSLDLDGWLRQVALVFQDVFLFSGSVRDNLRLARADATDEQIDRACRAARIRDVITALPEGYDTLLGERGARLSGGEKQRLSIARAFLKDAPVLILDEATAFADAQSEAMIQDALAELCKDKTVIVIAHKLSTIRNADRIVVLDDGRVVDVGTHDALIERSTTYQGLWSAYSRSLGWSLDNTANSAPSPRSNGPTATEDRPR
ncbi:MAG: ABC transporter ATP-binding protein [Myxococcota bacterium]